MKTVRPISIRGAVLDASSVAVSEADWNSGTTYSLAAPVKATASDALLHRYVSAQGSNTNHNPVTDDGTWWTDEGPVNRWAMFDDTSTTATTDADEIEVTLALPAGERMDVVYLAGLDAETVRIQIEDALAGPVHDETYSLAEVGAITSWHAWFFEPVERKSELLVGDLPNGAGAEVTVTIGHPGDTAACGNLVLGFRRALGDTAWGVETEIRDYSRWIENDFGDRVLVEGAYRKLMSATALLANVIKDAVERELTGARAQVRLYIADETYTSLTVFGTARWKTAMDGAPDVSRCVLQVEGNT